MLLSTCCSATMMIAPTAGPKIVPRPPSSVIRMTSPDICQCASVSEANWKTTALVDPARPEMPAERTKAISLIAVDVVAEREGAGLVFADRLQDLTEGRVDDAVDEEEAREEDGGDEIIHLQRLVQVDEAEEVAARNALKAVLAAREGQLQGEEVDDLRQREGDHGEVDALTADRQRADDIAQRGGEERAREDAEERRHAHRLISVARRYRRRRRRRRHGRRTEAR